MAFDASGPLKTPQFVLVLWEATAAIDVPNTQDKSLT